MVVRVENSFEALSQEEWDKYLTMDLFNDMYIKETPLSSLGDLIKNFDTIKLQEFIRAHNNKVGMLKITYALCRHYFDKGIPDEQWYMSPGKNGKSTENFPEFTEEHWMRKYWFNYFADVFYLKISALWDSVYEIINEYYQYNLESKSGFNLSVTKEVKNNNPSLYILLNEIYNNPLYQDGKKYRIAAAHGISIGEIKDTIKESQNVMVEIPKIVNGKVTMEKVKAYKSITLGVGDYVTTSTIMNHIENYSKYSGKKIQEIINILFA